MPSFQIANYEETTPVKPPKYKLESPRESVFPTTQEQLERGSVFFGNIINSIPSHSEISQLSAASLAYIGDALYELYVRAYYLLPPLRPCEYHRQVVAQVRAEQQATYLAIIEPELTEKEREIVRRGRNAAKGKPKRLSPQIYQQATSLETLIGYLYLQDPQRLHQLLSKISSQF